MQMQSWCLKIVSNTSHCHADSHPKISKLSAVYCVLLALGDPENCIPLTFLIVLIALTFNSQTVLCHFDMNCFFVYDFTSIKPGVPEFSVIHGVHLLFSHNF